MSLEDNQGKETAIGRDSSDSESSDNAKDDTPEPLEDGPSSLESQPRSLSANNAAAPPKNTPGLQGQTSAAAAEEKPARQPEGAPCNPDEEERSPPKSTPDQAIKTAPADTPAPVSKDSDGAASQLVSGKGTKPANLQDQKAEKKNLKNKKNTAAANQPALDQNANVEPKAKPTGQSKPKEKSQQDQKPKQNQAAEPQMLFGPQKPSKVMLTKNNTKSSAYNIFFLKGNEFGYFTCMHDSAGAGREPRRLQRGPRGDREARDGSAGRQRGGVDCGAKSGCRQRKQRRRRQVRRPG